MQISEYDITNEIGEHSYWKVSLYYAFIDHMILELESRLIKSENRFYAQYLLPRVIGNITNEQIANMRHTRLT